MYEVVGLKTNKVYVKSKDKIKCYRYLTRKYPYFFSKNGRVNDQLYQEPLMVIGPGVTNEHIEMTQIELHIRNKM